MKNKTLDVMVSTYSIELGVDSNDNIHAVWSFSDVGVRYMKLDNNGMIITNTTNVSNDLNEGDTSMVIDYNDNVHIVYSRSIPSSFQLTYMKLDNNGVVLVDNLPLTQESLTSRYPEIDVDSENNIHLVWNGGDDYTGKVDIYS